jgi:hypothetical protein
MMKKRGLAIMVAAFTVVLLGGVAVAQIADVFPGNDEPRTEAPSLAANVDADDRSMPATQRSLEPASDRDEPSDEDVADRSKDDEAREDEPRDDKDPAREDEPKDDEKPKDRDDPDTTPPDFKIVSPEDGAHVDDQVITVSGTVEPGSTVTFAGRYEAEVSNEGRWRIALRLEPGKNILTLVAKDRAGNAAEASVTVYFDRETDHRFTAHQKWEVVDGATAANKYYGTAAPGSVVLIVSEKGGAETRVEAGRNGEWEAHVEFPRAPCNEWFAVVVENAEGRQAFEMKWVCERDHRFSAHQKWEVVDGTPAMNKYYGTGVPGTVVWVVSEAGGAEKRVTVAANGEWEAAVEFPNAPCNERFAVVVEGDGGRKVFDMKWICPDGGEDVAFTAHQKYGSCGEAIPYDVFWGTEDAGTKIFVESRYGSGWTKANDHGEWEIRVEFPDAPVGEPFEVVIESNDGGREVFTFTRTDGGDH